MFRWARRNPCWERFSSQSKKGGIMVRKGGDFCALVTLVGMIGLAGWGGTSAFAQNFSAAISGLVRDTSGAVVPGVTVTAKHTESGLTHVPRSASGSGLVQRGHVVVQTSDSEGRLESAVPRGVFQRFEPREL